VKLRVTSEEVPIVSYRDHDSRTDVVTVEEPLEIWIAYEDKDAELVEFSLSITMRTPGDDRALVTGFLYSEGIIRSCEDIANIEEFGPITEPYGLQNQIKVALKSGERMADKNFQRYFYSSSSCGVCGKASIQALEMLHQPRIEETGFTIRSQTLRQLPEQLRSAQQEFDKTGGLHGVALIDSSGTILLSKEDIGRHNAMDKLIGQLVIENTLEMNDKMVLVSGRASFELVQKALMADIPCFASIGAPSSAAVGLANTFGMTLIGFLKENNYNVYHGPFRILD
jgi:FdhD protein